MKLLEEDTKNDKNTPIKINEVINWLVDNEDKNIPTAIKNILNHFCLEVKCETCKVRQILSRTKEEFSIFRETGTMMKNGMLETLSNELENQKKN